MPIYSYRCPDCQVESELLLSIEEMKNPFNCECGSKLERLMSAPTFRIKQSGRDMVLGTLNREYKTLPAKQVEIMAGGLDEPEVPVIGKGF